MSNDKHIESFKTTDIARHKVIIDTPTHFNFDEILAYLNRSPNECLHATDGYKVHKLIELEGDVLHIELEPSGDGQLSLTFVGEREHTVSQVEKAAQYVREWLDMETDLAEFYNVAEKDDLLRPVVDAHKGLRIVGIPELFEAICWAIIGQQINLTFAYALKRRFVESFGTSVDTMERKIWLFPSPHAIADLQTIDLTNLQFTRSKAAYILEVATQMSKGLLSKESLQRLGDPQLAFKALTDIRGIGPWTANYVLMRCLRDKTALPVQDVGLQNAIRRRLQMDRKPTISEIHEFARKWVGWEAYATFYLWRSLEESEAALRNEKASTKTKTTSES